MAASLAQREGVLGELQIVRKIRETVRRWWGIELSFTDAKGFVVDHGKGILIPPSNRMCTACLWGPCHRGLEIVAAPISFGGDRQGSLFACGFVVGEKVDAARAFAVDN